MKQSSTISLPILAHLERLSPYFELEYSIPSRVEKITPLADRLMQFIRKLTDKLPIGQEGELDIEIALHEALANAVIHGNDQDQDKRVHVNCRCTIDGEITLTIRDEGCGFDHRSVADPTDEAHLLLTHGRGIYLMRAHMDEVRFREDGTVVQMRKRLRPRPE